MVLPNIPNTRTLNSRLMENLLHRKIKGFKFVDDKLEYHSKMEKHEGETGKIIKVNKEDVKVQFGNDHWYYPIDQIQEHLIQG